MTKTSWIRAWITLLWFTASWSAFSQSGQPGSFQKSAIDSSIARIRRDTRLEAGLKSHLADSLFQVSKTHHLLCQQMESRILQSFSLDEMGLPDSALHQLLWVNANLTNSCPSYLRWRLYSGLTNVYLTLGELHQVDSLRLITQKNWLAIHSGYDIYFSILTNGAIALASSDQMVESIQLLNQILSEARRVNDVQYIQKSLINLATVMNMVENQDSSYHYLQLAAENSRLLNDADGYMRLLINLAVMDLQEGRFVKAKAGLDSAEALALKLNNVDIRATVLNNRSFLAEVQKHYVPAYDYLRDYLVLHDSILDQTRIKAVTDMQAKYESEKKARQIQQLEIANLDATLNNEKIRNTRNRFIFAGAGILLLAVGLFGRLRLVHRSKRAIQKEKDISEGLLLNILPAAVADELKATGAAEAKLYEQATILFSDFKSFTTIAGEMSAAELVSEINVCFKAFDEIMAEFGLEKIKTIGDSYMAAGSVPDNNKAEALHVIQAALAMQDFIINRKQERDAQQQLGFEMRIGIHTGPVVAGIVGIKKFQYDLWGDTVNIASRMETNGEPGYVNISSVTYELVKHEPALSFIPRGMIEVKGKGEMAMYFVRSNGVTEQGSNGVRE